MNTITVKGMYYGVKDGKEALITFKESFEVETKKPFVALSEVQNKLLRERILSKDEDAVFKGFKECALLKFEKKVSLDPNDQDNDLGLENGDNLDPEDEDIDLEDENDEEDDLDIEDDIA